MSTDFSRNNAALISGSLAYDNIMVFPGRFKDHILPEQIHILNVAFQVPEMRREFGGCAGNIAYNLHLLGGSPRIMATVGDDFAPYRARLEQLGIPLDKVRQVEGTLTAQAFITTDLDDNQITAFHPGAMNFSHLNRIEPGEAVFGIISPDGREGMLQHARDFVAAKIPFIFDPGQGLPMFSGEELLAFIDMADYACFNGYEARLTSERIGLAIKRLAERVKALIITRGGEGAEIWTGGECLSIPAVRAEALVDPTGCGDAHRAGLLFGLISGFDWQKTGQLASLMGAIKIASHGSQNHAPTQEFINSCFRREFGENLW